MTIGFHRVLAAETVSNFGSMLSRLAIPWLATLMLAATPLQMGWLLVADVAAGAFGALLLGAAIDRAPKRAVMLLCDLLRAALLAALALLAYQHLLVWWMLVVAAAASGVLTVAFELARSAWVALRVDAQDLPRCNAQLSLGGSLSETAAFALGGWLYQGVGAIAALALDAASYLASALCLRGVPEARQPTEETAASGRPRWAEFIDDAGAGLRLIAGRWRADAAGRARPNLAPDPRPARTAGARRRGHPQPGSGGDADGGAWRRMARNAAGHTHDLGRVGGVLRVGRGLRLVRLHDAPRGHGLNEGKGKTQDTTPEAAAMEWSGRILSELDDVAFRVMTVAGPKATSLPLALAREGLWRTERRRLLIDATCVS